MERTLRKLFRCGYEDHMIAKFPKQVCFNEKGNRACDNGKNKDDQKINAYMARMSSVMNVQVKSMVIVCN